MSQTNLPLPPEFESLVREIGDPVDSDQIDLYKKWSEIENNTYKIKTIVSAWEKQHTDERVMRKGFARAIIIALFIQIAVINIAFFFIGFSLISVPEWVATTFIIAVFTEIISMTMLVLRYLFPRVGSEIIQLIKEFR